MLAVGPLADLSLMPSGGVSPENANEWLDAGAAVVGMGANLVGGEIGLEPGTDQYREAADQWARFGRAKAERLFSVARALER